MSVYSDILDYLATDATVQAVVQTIRFSYAEQTDIRPFVVIDPVQETRPARSSANTGGKVSISVDVNCHSTTFEETQSIKEAVRKRLDHYRGQMGNTHISQCFLDNVTFDQPPPRQGQEVGFFTAKLNFSIIATEDNSEV